MKNQKLTVLARSRRGILNAIRRFGDGPAEDHLQRGLAWVDRAIAYTTDGKGGENACLMNAAVHLQDASRILGFEPVKVAI